MYKFGRGISLFYLNCFNKYRIKGKENIPQDGAYVLCANHVSVIDILMLNAAFKRKIFFLAKQELFSKPILGWFLKKYDAIPVDRNGLSISAVKQALRVLKEGNQLGIFPEGTRHNNRTGDDAKGGAVMFAYKCKVPVLPIHLVYKRKVMFFNSMEVRIGKPIDYTELGIEKPSSEEYKFAGEKLMAKIYEL